MLTLGKGSNDEAPGGGGGSSSGEGGEQSRGIIAVLRRKKVLAEASVAAHAAFVSSSERVGGHMLMAKSSWHIWRDVFENWRPGARMSLIRLCGGLTLPPLLAYCVLRSSGSSRGGTTAPSCGKLVCASCLAGKIDNEHRILDKGWFHHSIVPHRIRVCARVFRLGRRR